RVAFPKTFELLKPGGVLAMMLLHGDYKTPNEALYDRIQGVYGEYYKPEKQYKDMKEPFDYLHAADYGYVDFERRDFYGRREFTADEYVMYCGTHSDHMVIPEPYKTKFFEGLREAVLEFGNKVVFNDTYILYLTRKP
ncbi:MAG: SAM-dependent methyltransferase, partial [Lachnospiraceae bacterium]|nr:SAM-dependent methyltransferase [Lachnospiraceae bacterium]